MKIHCGIDTLIKAHQYLYYVKCSPVISDYDYDMLCRKHGIQGGGGSDMECDYSEEEIRIAEQLSQCTRQKPAS